MFESEQDGASALKLFAGGLEAVRESNVVTGMDGYAAGLAKSSAYTDEGSLGRVLYRLCERVAAAVILLATLPLLAIVAVIIKTGTAGPVLFFQNRVGKGGRVFRFVKFRTMYADARERFPELYRYAYEDAAIQTLVFKVKNDPRLSPQGRWLRKTSLDELPNFWNVLMGDMALVGPRPEIPEMLPYYKGRSLAKFSVRPGITGLAQICGRGNLCFLRTIELDLQYVRERSLWLDLRILVATVPSVLKGNGSH